MYSKSTPRRRLIRDVRSKSMKIHLLITALIALSPKLFADPIKVADTEITFEAPEGFKPLSKEIISTKWPTNQAPSFAVGTPSGSTTVAYDLKAHNVPQEALPEVQKSLTQFLERMIPGIDWKKNQIIDHSGQKWLLMEMTSNAVDTNIYNIMLITGFEGKMLAFNFNSTKEDFPKYEAELRKSLKSINLPTQ